MSQDVTILLLEDEPLILMDLEYAAEDRGCEVLTAHCPEEALGHLTRHGTNIDVAVLDVSLGEGKTCFPVASELDLAGIPYILHSGDLDRHNERIRRLDAELIAKPSATDFVIGRAIAQVHGTDASEQRLAAE